MAKKSEPCNISDKEITPASAATILAMTAAFPDDNNYQPPRDYEQCVDFSKIDVDGGPGDGRIE